MTAHPNAYHSHEMIQVGYVRGRMRIRSLSTTEKNPGQSSRELIEDATTRESNMGEEALNLRRIMPHVAGKTNFAGLTVDR